MKKIDYFSLMIEISRKIFALMIILSIALLPVRFAYAAGNGGVASGQQSTAVAASDICDHCDGKSSLGHCAGHMQNETEAAECCSDHCSGAQVFLASHFDFEFFSAKDFIPACLHPAPEPVASVQHRPPILIL